MPNNWSAASWCQAAAAAAEAVAALPSSLFALALRYGRNYEDRTMPPLYLALPTGRRAANAQLSRLWALGAVCVVLCSATTWCN
mmetsp:Transcript_11772/g.24236  ORF Transcript_11772/g.24236 Transcript_11772/m.24236 type:complete len:84 (+) Transcript_11772:748-999(+)